MADLYSGKFLDRNTIAHQGRCNSSQLNNGILGVGASISSMPHKIRQFDSSDTEAVIALWEQAGLTRPWNDPHTDIARKLTVQPELFLVAADSEDESIVGSVMAGYDGHRGWMYYLASDAARRGQGIGRDLVREVESRLEAMGCPKSMLMVRADNDRVIGFYDQLGYAEDRVAVLGKRLIED